MTTYETKVKNPEGRGVTELYVRIGSGVNTTPVSVDSWNKENDWQMLYTSRYILSPLGEMLTDALSEALTNMGYPADQAWEMADMIVSCDWGIVDNCDCADCDECLENDTRTEFEKATLPPLTL